MLQGIIDDRYEIVGLVGEGWTAKVYKALDKDLNRLVALKVIKESARSHAAALTRFNREAALLAKVPHSHIAQVIERGTLPDGRPYFVMEWLPGNLQTHVAQSLPIMDVLRLVAQTASGISALNAVGIIHRDIKPGNILLAVDGVAKVADLGVASNGNAPMTVTGAVIGTPVTMAPEMFRGEKPTPATDVYSLGCTLHALLAGRFPFLGDYNALAYQHLNVEPPSLPKAPAYVASIVERAMEKSPEDRYPSAGAMAADLLNARKRLAEGDRPRTRNRRQQVRRPRRPSFAAGFFSITLAMLTVAYLRNAGSMLKPADAESRPLTLPTQPVEFEPYGSDAAPIGYRLNDVLDPFTNEPLTAIITGLQGIIFLKIGPGIYPGRKDGVLRKINLTRPILIMRNKLSHADCVTFGIQPPGGYISGYSVARFGPKDAIDCVARATRLSQRTFRIPTLDELDVLLAIHPDKARELSASDWVGFGLPNQFGLYDVLNGREWAIESENSLVRRGVMHAAEERLPESPVAGLRLVTDAD